MAIEIRMCTVGLYRENAYVVRVPGREDCAVIDPGDGLEDLREAIGGLRVGAILITHGHFDHTQAAQALAWACGAPVYVHAADVEMMNDAAINAYDPMAASGPFQPVLETEDYPERLSVCGMDFDVLHTPGHSKGSVCLYLPGEAVLFSGDTLFEAGYGRLDLYGGDVREMVDSLKRLFRLPGDVKVYPGHGGTTTIAAERGRYRL